MSRTRVQVASRMAAALIVASAVVGSHSSRADLTGDGLDEIGIFGIESGGAARGPWFQAYDGEGKRVVNFFLDDTLSDFHMQSVDVDGKAGEEIAVLARDGKGQAVLLVRTGDGRPVDSTTVASGLGIESLSLFYLQADGEGAQEIGVGATTDSGAGVVEVWRLGTRNKLERFSRVEAVPADGGVLTWGAADFDADGDDELFVGAAPEVGAAIFRTFDAAGGDAIISKAGAGKAFGDVQWVLADFVPASPGAEILVGASRRAKGSGAFRVFSGSGALLSKAGVSGGRSSAHVWRAAAIGAFVGRASSEPSHVLVGFVNAQGDAAFGAYSAAVKRAAKVGGDTILDDTVQVEDWLAGNFDGDAENGDEVVALYTETANRDIGFVAHSLITSERIGKATALPSTYYEPQAKGIRAITDSRDDLLIAAAALGARPALVLWKVAGDGTLLLDLQVLSPGVQ